MLFPAGRSTERDNAMRVILIEDEKNVAGFISQGLRENGYEVDVLHDGGEAARRLEIERYDLYIIDWMLPGTDGLSLIRYLRKNRPGARILMLTARDTVDDRVRGLEGGADDYLTKPFAFKELLARVRSLLRRDGVAAAPATLRVNSLELDPLQRKARAGSREIPLSNKEFDLLLYLMKNVNKIIPREQIAAEVWSVDFDRGTNYIDVYINYLRKKLKEAKACPLILTVRGRGYILKPEND